MNGDWQKNGSLRLTREQVNNLAQAMNEDQVAEVDLSEGSDGRVLAKKVERVERLSVLKLTKRQ